VTLSLPRLASGFRRVARLAEHNTLRDFRLPPGSAPRPDIMTDLCLRARMVEFQRLLRSTGVADLGGEEALPALGYPSTLILSLLIRIFVGAASLLLLVFLCSFGFSGLLSQQGAIGFARDLQNNGAFDQAIEEGHGQGTIG